MPTANIYSSDKSLQDSLTASIPRLKELLAKELSCGDRTLVANEISIRQILVAESSAMIAPVEIEITAHSYAARAFRSDEICLLIRDFVKKERPDIIDVRVWLILAELGHSWHE